MNGHRFLVVGATGLVGSQIAILLADKGHEDVDEPHAGRRYADAGRPNRTAMGRAGSRGRPGCTLLASGNGQEQGLDEQTADFVVALDGNTRDGLLGDISRQLAELIGRPTTPLEATLRSWA